MLCGVYRCGPWRDCSWALLALLGLAAGAAPVFAADDEIVLKIGGDSGARFAATCLLTTEGGKESIAIDKLVPFKTTFAGSGLRCEITSAGAIEVELAKGGSRSFGSVSRGSVNVNVGS